MKTATEQKRDSILMEVRQLKEENAAEHGFDLRKIAAAARAAQKAHPHRMVTRMLPDSASSSGDEPVTRPALMSEI